MGDSERMRVGVRGDEHDDRLGNHGAGVDRGHPSSPSARFEDAVACGLRAAPCSVELNLLADLYIVIRKPPNLTMGKIYKAAERTITEDEEGT